MSILDLRLPPFIRDGNPACSPDIGDDFYAHGHGASSTATRLYAKRICRGCPVMAECLQWALEHDEQEGVWGGLDPNERAALRRKR